jgi:hypothetical protein
MVRAVKMKKTANHNQHCMLDWLLAIDFDPVKIVDVRCYMSSVYVSGLAKDNRSKRGD